MGFTADCCSCRPNALSPFILCCSASPQKVSLGSNNESLFHSRRVEVIDSGRASLCFLSGKRGGKKSNMAAPAARATSLSALSPFRYHPHPRRSLKALFLLRLPLLQTGSDKFDLAARGRPFPRKENKYCYNGNNIYLERWRQTAAGPFEGDPSVLPIAALFLFMKAAVMHISAN